MRLKTSALLLICLSFSAGVVAQKPVAPALNSNPGALYNVFLNFTGFDYNGTWAGRTPGNVPAYTLDGDPTTFNTSEINNIKEIWARVAQKYIGFNINITTVDPAPSNFTDAQRKTFYDNKQYFTHAMIGGTNAWYGNAGGVSYVGVAKQATTSNGMRTNWTFSATGSLSDPHRCTAACAHEVGHHLGLLHQRDETANTEYSNNAGATGNGSYAPIMGTSYVSQRGTWRQGKAGVNANDVAVLQQNLNIGPLLDSGIGHTLATASQLSVRPDGTIDSTQAKGWIMPKASTGYSAVGESSYTTDFFVFSSLGGTASLTAHDGTQFLNPGTADPGATGRTKLRILDSNGNLVGVATEDASTLRRTWTGTLAPGTYYAQVSSFGEYISSYEPDSRYFNMGAYFLSGSGITAVPEPTMLIGMGIGLAALGRRRKKSA